MENNEQIILRKIRNFGDIIGDTFTIIRHGYKPLGKALLYIVGPLLLITAIVSGFINAETFSASGIIPAVNIPDDAFKGMPSSLFLLIAGLVVTTIFSFVLFFLMQLFACEYVKLYNSADYSGITFNNLLSASGKDFFMLLFTNIGVSFIIFFCIGIIFGSVFLITFMAENAGSWVIVLPVFIILLSIFFIYIIIPLSFIPVVRVIERSGFFASIGRSFGIAAGNWWTTFGLLLVLFIIITILGSIFGLPYFAIIGFTTFHSIEGSGDMMLNIKPLIIAASALSMMSYFLYVIPMISICLKYFSIVEKKEGAGLIEKIDSLTQ